MGSVDGTAGLNRVAGAAGGRFAGGHGGLRLDPRAKLHLLLLANMLLFFHVSTRVEAVMVALFLSLLFLAGRWRSGLRFAAIYAVLLALGLWSDAAMPAATGGVAWLHIIGLFSVGLRMMMPCLITGAYAFTTTTVSEFVCALRRMRAPEAVVVPCMVVIRFFPTITQDYRQIRNAMALRGIAAGRCALIRHPAQSLEYIIVPLLMNATVVAQDLSVAALTKGLGIRGIHTSMTDIRLRAADWLAMTVCTVPLALSIGGVL